jgi:hypothetical protein
MLGLRVAPKDDPPGTPGDVVRVEKRGRCLVGDDGGVSTGKPCLATGPSAGAEGQEAGGGGAEGAAFNRVEKVLTTDRRINRADRGRQH